MTTEDLRAYWFSFTPTGSADIDAILLAIVNAGSAFHSTEGWGEPIPDEGRTYAEAIQDAAQKAAKAKVPNLLDAVRAEIGRRRVSSLEAENARLRAMIGLPLESTSADHHG